MARHPPCSTASSFFHAACKSDTPSSLILPWLRPRSFISIPFHPFVSSILQWFRASLLKQASERGGHINFQAMHVQYTLNLGAGFRRSFHINKLEIAHNENCDPSGGICGHRCVKVSSSCQLQRSLHIGSVVRAKKGGFDRFIRIPVFREGAERRPIKSVKGCNCMKQNLNLINDNKCISCRMQHSRHISGSRSCDTLTNDSQQGVSMSSIGDIDLPRGLLSDSSSRKILDGSNVLQRDLDNGLEGDKLKRKVRLRSPYLAELVLPEQELKRLRDLSASVTCEIKIGKHGITDSVVTTIRKEWRRWEVVKVKCEGALAVNMKKTHEDLENKTGGLVIWKAGSAAAIYRGKGNVPPGTGLSGHEKDASADKEMKIKGSMKGEMNFSNLAGKSERGAANLESQYHKEVESVMEGLGPRFEGWTGAKPIPIDGDMLPAIDSAFQRPVRRLPEGVKASLSDIELTVLRKLSRPLPTHFVLGRNKGLQGLADAIVKLWERSEIAKIQIKKGVQHTRNQTMSGELKRLTGGILISRDKYFISLYRGKDFLPAAVAAALSDQEANAHQVEETEHRLCNGYGDAKEGHSSISAIGMVMSEWENWRNLEEQRKNRNATIVAAREQEARRVSHKLAVLMAKKRRAEEDLAKVEEYLNHFNLPSDHESITYEEMKILREVGLKTEGCLMIGKLSSLNVIIESMHSQWKQKELVKLTLLDFDKGSAKETAKILEYETGGIFVTMFSASKGQVVIFYRGNSYQPRSPSATKSILKKGTAIKNCLRMKHRESLERHLLAVEKEINKIKLRSDDLRLEYPSN
ncbi:hypothetical protein O6H91_01G011800 [Diphasiastrum complanatum]|uniref:Uncharacterized protein n=2 Tax=Diphasiastrum complanatum TaxID=34168 RepID=A0ACC2EN51_DIPCM|nr:hypothetical protein O6H91_01G011800 [Diphasiastrum complanatum]KAJ7567912.1 hypothetical protein O6H91_01G011800 [Diphasiastrum complanatum]